MFTELKNNKCTKICATSVVVKEMKIEISKGYDFFLKIRVEKLEDLMIITVREGTDKGQ